jgi:hypothetical protein
VSDTIRHRAEAIYLTLDPIRLLQDIRSIQQRLAEVADKIPAADSVAPDGAAINQFLAGLRTAWRQGEIRPTHQPKPKARRGWRRPDPFASVTADLKAWFEAEPWRTAPEPLERLQEQHPGAYSDQLLRTLQRRVKIWRRDRANELVFGIAAPAGVDAIVGQLLA